MQCFENTNSGHYIGIVIYRIFVAIMAFGLVVWGLSKDKKGQAIVISQRFPGKMFRYAIDRRNKRSLKMKCVGCRKVSEAGSCARPMAVGTIIGDTWHTSPDYPKTDHICADNLESIAEVMVEQIRRLVVIHIALFL